MNKEKRTRLKNAISKIEEAQSIIEMIKDDEQDVYDNTPENFQGCARYDILGDTVETLGEAAETLTDVKNKVTSVL